MKSFCIGVLAGSLLSLFLPIVPPFLSVFLLIPVILILLTYSRLFCVGIVAFFICFIWQFNAYHKAQRELLVSANSVTGVIVDTPRHYAEYSQFTLKLDAGAAAGFFVAISWSNPAVVLQQGQRWQLNARFRPVAGVANPAGVNKETAALLEQVLAQGSVVTLPAPQLLSAQQGIRSRWLSDITAAIAPLPTAPLLLALTMGERQFSPSLWLGLQLSGLAHLVAISGLHIGLVFGWGMLLFRLLPWPIHALRWRRPAAIFSALLLAVGYAWLAGFAVPTIRATVALMLLAGALLQRKSLSYLSFWLLLAALLLLVQPMFVLSKSFWLSMLAVAVIFFVLWRWPSSGTGWYSKFKALLVFHLVLTLFMSLLSFLMFDGSASLSLLSNLLFVPWCSLLAIPVLLICLLAELSAVPGSQLLWQLCDLLFQPLMWWLQWCANYGRWWVLPELSLLQVLMVAALCVLMLLMRKTALAVLVCMVLLPSLYQLTRPAGWQLHLIDVGQGLAVLLQHGTHGLLYDAGPRYGEYSATSAQVLPYLRQRGIRKLDYLVLSHDDSDHTGNWQLLKQAFPDTNIYSDISHISPAQPCNKLPGYFFQAQLRVLHSGNSGSKNDSSCVLMLSVHGWNILLPGDISQKVELELLRKYPALKTNVLVLAHHGSHSSSHYKFLHQLAPQLALNSASLYNRHQHPAEQVQQRLDMLGIALFNTANSGALTLHISPNSLVLEEYRAQRIPFWQQKPSTNAETLVTTR